jgi:hypothetical protein
VPRLRDPQRVRNRNDFMLLRRRVGDYREVGRLVGCSHQVIHRLETGDAEQVGKSIALGIAEVLTQTRAEPDSEEYGKAVERTFERLFEPGQGTRSPAVPLREVS